MNENEIIDVNDEDVCIEDIVDGSGHPVLTIIASLLGGAAIGAGSKFLYDKITKDKKDQKKLEKKQKKLAKLKKDAEKLGIDLSDIPEIEIPEDEEIEEIKLETETDEKVEEKPKKGGKKK